MQVGQDLDVPYNTVDPAHCGDWDGLFPNAARHDVQRMAISERGCRSRHRELNILTLPGT